VPLKSKIPLTKALPAEEVKIKLRGFVMAIMYGHIGKP
jgi:hypothetical protein